MTKKENLLNSILNIVNSLDIAGYLKEEVFSLFKYLNYYKLKNIYLNIDSLQEYLIFLDYHNTKQICLYECVHIVSSNVAKTQDLLYYVSSNGLSTVGKDLLQKKVFEDYYGLCYVMQAVKGFLLLTADEFCNATSTRMSITRVLWNKQMVDKKTKQYSSYSF